MSRSQRRTVPATVRPLLLALIGLLLLAPSRGAAAVPVTSLFAAPITASSPCNPTGAGATTSTQAGSRSDFCLAYALDSPPPDGDDLQTEVIDTPLGFAGDPTNRPACTAAQFAADTTADVTCPATAQVGDARVNLRLLVAGSPLALTGVTGRAFNLVPSDDEVARIGIVLDPPANPKVKILVHITLRPAPNVGLRSTIDNLPRTTCLTFPTPGCGYPISTDAFALRFWGSVADHPIMPAPFALLGADCSTDQVTTLSGVSYDGTPTSAQSRYQLTDCASAPFQPSVSVATDDTRPDVPSAATVTARFGTGTATRVAAPPKRTVVTLPPGLTLAAQIASGPQGLAACSAEQFARTSAAAATCPAAAAVGTVRIVSPVLTDPLQGTVYVGAQSAVGALPDLYVDAALSTASDAPRVKLVGQLSVDDAGRLVTTLDDLPQVPSSEVTLRFRGGDQAPLVTPEQCGDGSATMVATPLGGADPTTVTAPYAVNADCGAAGGFAPAVAFSSADGVAGGTGAFNTGFSRPDRTQRFAHTVIDLPPGQVANLKGVPECPQDVAARGACDPGTRIGSVRATAGVGPAPSRIDGEVFLTARSEGAVAGISIHTRVKLGDVDLGSLDVPARIEIRPEDLGLRIVADVPQRFRGLPLDLRSLDVSLDRQGFPRAPTNCGTLQSVSQLTGSGGATASVLASYQVHGCDRLAFDPAVAIAVTGQTTNKGRPDIDVRIANAAGSAALQRTDVMLPEGIGVDLAQIPRACPQDAFRAGTCAGTARIGTISGALSIADEPLTGNVYLLKPAAGAVLPGLGLEFTGRFAGRVTGTTAVDAKTSRLITRFSTIPDLPLTELSIHVSGGDGGPLVATSALCAQQVGVDATLVGQNGRTVQRGSSTLCGAKLGELLASVTARMSGLRKGTPVLRLRGAGASTRKLTRVDLTLPPGWALASQRGRPGGRYAKVSGLSTKSSAKVLRRSPRRLRITMPKGGSSKFSLLTRTGTIRVAKSSNRKTKKAVAVTARITYADGAVRAVPLLVTPR